MRSELEARPLLWLALAFMGGLASHFFLWAALVGLSCLASDRRWRVWLVGVLLFLFGVLIGQRPPKLISENREFSGQVFVVQSPRPSMNGERALVMASGRKLVMYFDADQPVANRDTLLVRGRVRPVDERSREYWRHQGVSGILSLSGPIWRHEAGPPVYRWGQEIRRSFVRYSDRFLDRQPRAVVQAVCFNHDVNLTREERDLLANSGIIHIISTSGMHVVLLAGALGGLLALLPLPRWLQIALLITALLVYGAAAGFRPPMVRSIVMASLWVSAFLFKREADGLSITAFSAIVTLLFEPSAVFDLGFLLSFTTITALMMFMPLSLRELNSIAAFFIERAKQTLFASLIATAASAPILSMFFGRFSIVGVFTNLLIVPVVPVLVGASLIAWLISGFAPELATQISNVLVAPLAYFCMGVASVFGNLPWATITLPSVPALGVILFYCFAVLLWRPRKRLAEE